MTLCTAGKAVQLIHVLAGGLHVFMHARHIRIEPLLLLTAATSFHRCFSLLCVIIERSETCLNVLVGLTGECNLGACSQRQNPTPPDLALRCCTLEHTPTAVFVPISAFLQMRNLTIDFHLPMTAGESMEEKVGGNVRFYEVRRGFTSPHIFALRSVSEE